MSISPYRAVLRLPGVARLLAFAVLARIPQTASGVVLTLYVVGVLDRGYGAAGLVVTAATVGMAAGGPWRGRVVDRHGLRRALLSSVLGSAVSWGLAPFVGFGPLLVVAFAGGLLAVPIFGVTRQSLSVLVPVERQRTAFALDSMGTEISFMVGPAAGVLLATQLSATVALLAVGSGSVLCGLALMLLDPPVRSAAGGQVAEASSGSWSAEASNGSRPDGSVAGLAAPVTAAGGVDTVRQAPWYAPGLLAVLGAALAAGLVLAGTDVALVAQLREAGALEMTALVFLAWSGGSLVGGAVYGAMRRSVPPAVLLLGLALLTVPVGLAPSPMLLAVTILPAAALCAPLISATAEAVSRLVPERARGEAMGWHGSALTVGSALGGPVSGAAIDAVAPWVGFAAVGSVGGLLAGLGLLLLRDGPGPAGTENSDGPGPAGTENSDGPGPAGTEEQVGEEEGDEPGPGDEAQRRVVTWYS